MSVCMLCELVQETSINGVEAHDIRLANTKIGCRDHHRIVELLQV